MDKIKNNYIVIYNIVIIVKNGIGEKYAMLLGDFVRFFSKSTLLLKNQL